MKSLARRKYKLLLSVVVMISFPEDKVAAVQKPSHRLV